MGYLISFEGVDGSGKSTLLHRVIDWFEEKNIDYVLLREPGGTKIGDEVRDILHSLENLNFSDRAELLLYLGSRAQITDERIKRELGEGRVVIMDRFRDSTIVYQGYARGLGAQRASDLNDFATDNIRPDLTILLDLDPKEALERRRKNMDEWNRMDAQVSEFHKKVYEGYRVLHHFDDENRWEMVDASQSPEEVLRDTVSILEDRLSMVGILEGNRSGVERR